jgi:hypothetical protein
MPGSAASELLVGAAGPGARAKLMSNVSGAGKLSGSKLSTAPALARAKAITAAGPGAVSHSEGVAEEKRRSSLSPTERRNSNLALEQQLGQLSPTECRSSISEEVQPKVTDAQRNARRRPTVKRTMPCSPANASPAAAPAAHFQRFNNSDPSSPAPSAAPAPARGAGKPKRASARVKK